MRLVLLDLDKTLIDERYRLTIDSARVVEVVTTCANAGISVGFCSDSPLLTLMQWAQQLHIGGPIVFEQGAGVYQSAAQTSTIVLPEATTWFSELRKRFVTKMMDRLPEWGVYVGDNTDFIRSGQRFPGACRFVALVSGIRQQSFGVHVRRVQGTDGELTIDTEALHMIRGEGEAIARQLSSKTLDIDENPEYGILIIHSMRTEKRNGVRFLIEHEHPELVAMIGDSPRDYMDDARIIQYAVGNARAEYKERCVYVADTTYTAGVLEILNRLLQEH